MTPFASLRVRFAVAAATLALVIVAGAGALIALQIDVADRAAVDSALADRIERVSADIEKVLDGSGGGRADDEFGDLLGDSQSLVRLFSNGQLIAQRGELPVNDPPPPTVDGYETVMVDGESWRSLTDTVEESGIRLQVLQSLQPLEAGSARTAGVITIVTLGSVLIGGAGGALVAGAVMRPLYRLRAAATRIRSDPDPAHRLPPVSSPREVADLSETLNEMLRRIQEGAEAARRFTADAGHELRAPLTSMGAYLETLARQPGPTGERRAEMVRDLRSEYARLVALLDGLQVLARGDAGVLPAREEVDLGAIVVESVRRARIRHPQVTFQLEVRGTAEVIGWADGLRLAVDNLLENAAIHGATEGLVEVAVSSRGDVSSIVVTDDGEGLTDAERNRVMGRFVRGDRPRGEGSGLGLALVAQQAELHGGRLELSTGPSGGLQAEFSLLPPPQTDPPR